MRKNIIKGILDTTKEAIIRLHARRQAKKASSSSSSDDADELIRYRSKEWIPPAPEPPTEKEIEEARRNGMAWNGEEWISTVPILTFEEQCELWAAEGEKIIKEKERLKQEQEKEQVQIKKSVCKGKVR